MKTPFLVTLYYTLASIIGLVLTVIGATMLFNLLLTTYILKIPRYPSQPPMPYGFENPAEPIQKIEARMGSELTDDDRKMLENWKQSYSQWQKDQEYYDTQQVDKKNQLASSVSMLVVGLPVLFFHLRVLRRKKE